MCSFLAIVLAGFLALCFSGGVVLQCPWFFSCGSSVFVCYFLKEGFVLEWFLGCLGWF